ncbi:hypothetical protein D9M71_707120 [compost metagenome]
MTEYRESLPCPCGDENCGKNPPGGSEEDFDDLPTLDEMISSAVAAGIEQYEKKRLAAEKKASKSKATKVTEKSE